MKVINAKIIGTIIGAILFILLTAGLTYAFLLWRSNETEITATPECFDVEYTKGDNITSANLKLFDSKEIFPSDNIMKIKKGMAITNVSALLKEECEIDAVLDIILDVTKLDASYQENGDSRTALQYAILKYSKDTYPSIDDTTLNDQTFTVVKTDSIDNVGEQTIYEVKLPRNENLEYLIVFFVDGDLSFNNSQNTEFEANIKAAAKQIELATALDTEP